MNATNVRPDTVPTVVLEPAAQALADALAAGGGPPLYTLSPEEARAVLDQAQAGDVAMARCRDRGAHHSGRAERHDLGHRCASQWDTMAACPRSSTRMAAAGCSETSPPTSGWCAI